MKKLISIFLLLNFLSLNQCLAFSELYYFKNIKTSEVEPVVVNGLNSERFKIEKQNPYFATSPAGDDKAIIVLQQSGDNMFYYYQADKNTKINKAILKEIKKRNIVCEQSFNTGIISIYDDIASMLIANSGSSRKYTFEEEPVYTTPSARYEMQQPQTFSGYVAQISAGTKINIYLQNSINTATAVKGDRVTAVVSDNLIYNGKIVIPQGSVVYGTLSKARNASYGSRNGRVILVFNQIVTPENSVYNISAEEIDFSVSNDGKLTETAVNSVKSAAVGALIGLVFGLLSDNHVGKSAAIGAGVGAGSTLIYSAAERGVDAEIPSFTEMELTLTSPLNVSVSK